MKVLLCKNLQKNSLEDTKLSLTRKATLTQRVKASLTWFSFYESISPSTKFSSSSARANKIFYEKIEEKRFF